MTSNENITRILNIRVNYEKAIEQLAQLRKGIDDTNDAVKKLNKDRKNLTTEDYNKQLSALDQRLRSLKDSYRTVTRSVQNQVKNETLQKGSLAALRAQLSILTRQYDTMSGAARKGAEGIRKMMEINKVTNEIKEAEKATQRFYRNVGNYTSALRGINEMTKGFRTLGGFITKIFGGLTWGKFTENMVNVAREFEDAMARVRAVSNPMQGEFDAMRDKARDLGRTTRYTAGEAAEGMELLARNGLSAKQSIDAITPTLQLAQANVVSIAEAAQISTNVMNAFGKSTAELTRVNDILSSTCAHSATNLKELAESMKVAAPIAHTAQVPIEQTAAALGVLANVGMRGSDAGTGIKQMLMALTKASTLKNGSAVLKKYNLDITETTIKTKGLLETLKEMKKSGLDKSLTDIGTLVGKYAAPRMAALISNVDQMTELTDTLENSLGENARMFEQSLSTTSKAIYELKSAWESFMLDVWDNTSEYLVKPIEYFTKVLRFAGENVTAIGQAVASVMASYALLPALKRTWALASSAFKMSVAERVAIQQSQYEPQIIASENRIAEYKVRIGKIERMRAKADATAELIIRAQMETDLTKLTAEQLRLRQLDYHKYDALVMSLDQERARVMGLREAELTNLQNIELAKRNAAHIKFATLAKFAWTSFLTVGKAAITGIKMAFSTFAPMLLLTAIFEAIQGFMRMAESARKVKEAALDINADIRKSVETNDTLAQLRFIQRELDRIHNKRVKNNKDVKDEKELMAKANSLLGKNYTTHNSINLALRKRIQLMQQQLKIQALQNTYSESYKQIMEVAAKFGVSGDTPREIYNNLRKQFNDKEWWEKGGQRALEFFGVDNLSALIDHVVEPALARFEYAQNRLKLVERATALGEAENTNTSTTPSGPFQPTDPYSKKDKEKNIENKFNEMLKKYQGLLEKTIADNTQETYERRIEQANVVYDKIKREVDFALDPKSQGGVDSENSIFKKIMASPKISEEQKEALKKVMLDYVAEAAKYRDIQHEKIHQEAVEQAFKDEIELWDARIAVAADKSDEKYKLEQEKGAKELRLAQEELQTRYLKGEFGNTRNLTSVQGKAEYDKKKSEYDSALASGRISPEEHKNLVDSLDADYKAVLNYYHLKELLDIRYQQQEMERARQHQVDLVEIQRQALENRLNDQKLAFTRMIAERTDAYRDMEFATGDYWERLKSRIGVEQAIELQMQYEQADKELEALQRRGKQQDETQEEYDGKLIAAEQKKTEVHIQANEAIRTSDEGRLEAASTVTGGLIQLSQALGEEDSEAAKLAKVLALAQIAINTGVAISKLTSAEASKGVPVGLATTAAGIAEILANIATAITTVKSAKFAQGGKVNGAGTGTSDSIPAQLSNGEFVMTARATKLFEPILTVMNSIGAGVALPKNGWVTNNPSQMNDFQTAMTLAISEIQPVVSVKEITNTQNRVKVIQNLDSI